LAKPGKPVGQEKILSLLHQAVVEVVTLRDSASCTLSFDLRHVTYPPAALASISNAAIAYCDIKQEIILRHVEGGELNILEAITSRPLTSRQRIPAIASLKSVEGEARAEAKAEVQAGMKSDAKTSDLSGNPTGAPDKRFNNRQTMETTVTAQDIVNKPAPLSKSNIQSNQGSKNGFVERLLTPKGLSGVSGAGSLHLFATMPLEPLEFRFAVSLLDSDLSDCANSMLTRSSSGYPS